MEISRLNDQTVEIAGLDPFLAELLHEISPAADPTGSAAAEARLYSTPTGGGEPEFDEEWGELVEPDIREYFASSIEIVQGDLLGFPSDESDRGAYQLQIPMAHIESWIHALNQARLALAARYDVSDKDMNDLPTGRDSRARSVFQIHFYGFLQECFLRQMDEL